MEENHRVGLNLKLNNSNYRDVEYASRNALDDSLIKIKFLFIIIFNQKNSIITIEATNTVVNITTVGDSKAVGNYLSYFINKILMFVYGYNDSIFSLSSFFIYCSIISTYIFECTSPLSLFHI